MSNYIWIIFLIILVLALLVLWKFKLQKKTNETKIPNKFTTPEEIDSQKSRSEKFTALLGGKDNIKEIISCKTRLKITVNSMSKVNTENEDYVNNGAGGIIIKKNNQIDIIVGFDVSKVAYEMEKINKS